MRPLLVLVGPPGSGKTTVGELAAHHLGVTFRDTDRDIEQRAAKPIGDIFVEDGEPAFRAMEVEAVATALSEHDGVLALGGGAVLDPATQQRLRGHHVVFLDVGLTDAVERVGFARSRPLLVLNPRAELKRMLAARRPAYLQVAAVTVATDGRTPDEVAADVVATVERSE